MIISDKDSFANINQNNRKNWEEKENLASIWNTIYWEIIYEG